MPTPLIKGKTSASTPRDRVDAFRQTIKPGQGWHAYEVADALNTVPGSSPLTPEAVRAVMHRQRWGVRQWSNEYRRICFMLVNPKDLKKYAN